MGLKIGSGVFGCLSNKIRAKEERMGIQFRRALSASFVVFLAALFCGAANATTIPNTTQRIVYPPIRKRVLYYQSQLVLSKRRALSSRRTAVWDICNSVSWVCIGSLARVSQFSAMALESESRQFSAA